MPHWAQVACEVLGGGLLGIGAVGVSSALCGMIRRLL